MRYYEQFSVFCGSRFRIWSYAGIVEQKKTSPKTVVTTTNSGGITVVDTRALLSQPSVLKAIKTLGDKAISAGAKNNGH